MPSFGKILGAVPEIMRYGRTDARADRTDFIGPSRFITGDQKPRSSTYRGWRSTPHIVGKSIAWTLREEVQIAAGPLQMSSGLEAGAEHTMRDIFAADKCDAVILVNATNAFKLPFS